MLVGGIGIVDLRIMGLWRSLPIAERSRALTPVAVAGLVLMVARGTILFTAAGVGRQRSCISARKLDIITAALATAADLRRALAPHRARWKLGRAHDLHPI